MLGKNFKVIVYCEVCVDGSSIKIMLAVGKSVISVKTAFDFTR